MSSSKHPDVVLGTGAKPAQDGDLAKPAKVSADEMSHDAVIPAQADTTGAQAPGDDSKEDSK